MKAFVVFAVVCVAAVLAEEAAKPAAAEEAKGKTYKRLIPADVLRGKFFLIFNQIYEKNWILFWKELNVDSFRSRSE